MREIKEKTTPSDFIFAQSQTMANNEFQKAQSLILELQEALAPFAKLSETWPQAVGYWEFVVSAHSGTAPQTPDFTGDDVRRAAQALALSQDEKRSADAPPPGTEPA